MSAKLSALATASPLELLSGDLNIVASSLQRAQKELEAATGGRQSWLDGAVAIARDRASNPLPAAPTAHTDSDVARTIRVTFERLQRIGDQKIVSDIVYGWLKQSGLAVLEEDADMLCGAFLGQIARLRDGKGDPSDQEVMRELAAMNKHATEHNAHPQLTTKFQLIDLKAAEEELRRTTTQKPRQFIVADGLSPVPHVVLCMEGGIITSTLAATPIMVTVIDYDTEDCVDRDDLVLIPQGDDKMAEAYATVDQAFVDAARTAELIDAVESAVRANDEHPVHK